MVKSLMENLHSCDEFKAKTPMRALAVLLSCTDCGIEPTIEEFSRGVPRLMLLGIHTV